MARKPPFFMGNKEIASLHRVTNPTARSIAKKIRIYFNKKRFQPITVTEYAKYINVPVEEVYRALE